MVRDWGYSVSPILGIIASQNYVRIPPTSYESIATVNATGSSGTITFTSIPSTFKHLQVRAIGRGTYADTNTYPDIRFNSDSGSNYSWHILDGYGSSVSASGAANQISAGVPTFTAAQSGGNIFGVMVLDILDYQDTNKYKTVRYLGGHDQNGSGILRLGSGSWRNTNAITSVSFLFTSQNWAQYSQFALYGIK